MIKFEEPLQDYIISESLCSPVKTESVSAASPTLLSAMPRLSSLDVSLWDNKLNASPNSNKPLDISFPFLTNPLACCTTFFICVSSALMYFSISSKRSSSGDRTKSVPYTDVEREVLVSANHCFIPAFLAGGG